MTRPHIELTSTKPCDQSWTAMSGTLSGRHCESCNKTVHNIANLTTDQLEHLVHANRGSFCAQITRDRSGQIITAPSPSGICTAAASIAFSTVLGATLQARAQVTPNVATVSGKVLLKESKLPAAQAQVIFVQNSIQVASTQTDAEGTWETSLPTGTYDVIFRTGALMGERVNAVTMHAGQQSFSPVTARFAYGHLQPEDGPSEVTVTVGEVTSTITGMSFRYAVRHPLSYLAMMRRRITHSFT